MKKLSSIFFVKYLLIGICSLSFVNLNAQTCDENVLKGLENTRIYYHKEVTKGSNASFFIKNPLKGTTYSFIDKATGVAYSKLYIGVPEELTIEIPVGKVDVGRKFYLKAENGSCTFSQPNNYNFEKSILPDEKTAPKLSLSVEEEWCTNAGAIHINVVNGSISDYKFYAKKGNGAFVELSQPDYTSLSAGSYTIKAVHKTTNKELITSVNLSNKVKPVKFSLEVVPEACSGKQAIYVDTTKDENGRNVTNSAPLFFTLYDKNNAIVRPAQLSPVFSNLSPDEYSVRVNDNCGTGTGGNALTRSINLSATLSALNIEKILYFTAKAGCPYMKEINVGFKAKNIRNIIKADLLTYPIEFNLQIESPTGRIYPIHIKANNKQEFTEYFWGDGDQLKLISNKVVQNTIPAEAGKWKVKGTYTLCGRVHNLNEKESDTVYLPLDQVYIMDSNLPNAIGCRTKRMVLSANDQALLRNYYVILEEAPAGFDYAAAGFYKVNSTNPLLQNKWVKFFPDTSSQTLLNPEFITEGFTYKFKIVDECSGKTRELTRPGYKSTPNLEVDYKVYASCTDNNGNPDPTALWKNVIFQKRSNTSSLSKVEILSYTKNSAYPDYKSLVPITLPFTLTDAYKTGQERWEIKLPPGDYKVRYTDACNLTEERKIEVRGTDNTELKWEEQNCQTTVSIIRKTTAYAPSGIVYIIEIYNPKEQVWEPLKTAGQTKTILTLDNTNNHRVTFYQGGKFRVIRAISRDQGATIDCPKVIDEREISKGEMRVPTITRLDCSAVGGAQKYHIVITPQGGTPPYSYVLKSKEEDQIVGGVTQKVTTVIDKVNGNNNFFINIDETNASARYKFIVKDACNVEKSIDETLSNIQPFKIEKNQQFYCLNAKGIISLPKIEGLTYAWYRKDNPANILSTSNQLVIEHLTQDDLDKEFAVKLTLTNVTDALVKNCIETNLNGMDSIRFNAIPNLTQTYQAPNAQNTTTCIVPNGNETLYNVNALFSNQPTTLETGVRTEVVEKTGIISVAKDGIIKLNVNTIGKYTFVYKIITDCGVVTQTEATLAVKGFTSFGNFNTEVCASTVTFDELQKLGQKAYPDWFILAKPEQYLFEWYATENDARNRTNKLTATSVTLNEGETKQYYVKIRINNENSCFFPNPSLFKVTHIATGAKPNKAVTLCKGATVGELKQNIDKQNKERIVIYKGTQKLTDDYVLQVGTSYTYTYLIGTCETAPANITLTLSDRTVATIETFVTCEYERDWGGLGVPYKKVEDYLKGKYGATTVVKVYSEGIQGALNGNTLMYLGSEKYTFTVEAAGKCVSNLYPIRVYADTSLANFTVAQKTQVLCSGTNQTLASLQPQGANIVWYATATDVTPLAKTTPLVAGTTYYVAQKNGTCESDRVAVAVTQGASGNETLVFSTPFSKTLKCVPSGQLRFQVQNAVAGQSYVVELTEVPVGYTGSRTFTITKDNKEGNVPFVWLTQNNIPKGTYKARLVKCGVSQEIGQTITELTSNFPIRDNFDAGPYVDINDCNYVNLRNSQARAGGIDINAYFQNEAIAKQFFEYIAVSPQDMTDKGWTNTSQIPDSYWREVYSLPAGVTSSQPKVIYYDLAAFGRNYADLAIANKKPKFYFRIKGQPSCGVSAPIEFGDTRMLTMKMAYGGSCTAPTIKISLDRTVIVCKPITYEVKNEAGQVVASGSTNVANAIIDITNLNGNPINPNEKYSVTVKAAAPDTQSVTTIARSFNQAKAAYRPDGQYAEIKRCFGHPERTEMYIQGFLRDENGVLLSLKGYKVTLESAPAGYANEPNKLKVGESYTITRDASSYNLLSTLNVQNAAGFSSLPEGDYKIKIEDPCGQTYYVENGRRKKANILTIEHPQYSEKPLTPEKEVACTGVRVYPFKGNTAQDWLKKNNQNQNLYVWLVKIPAGVNAADISTTPQQPATYAGNTYQRAIYSRDNAATLDTYFTLPRNENSTGLYTFAYAEDEREIYNYIANSPTACVRTFTISVDDVLLNIDRSTYVGYKCEGGTGKIVVKAVNGINDANNYTYELYATKTGTVIETKTAAKGTTVTFTNLGTFTAGQNTRWLKLTDVSCPTQSMWRELPIDILEKPANGKTYTFCAAATVAELKAKVATDTATVNVYKNGTLVTNNNEVLTTTDAYTISRFNATCETDKVAVTVTISNTVSLTVPATLTVTCTAANIDATVNNWLGQATVTDTCGTATLTHDFAAVKPTNWCNTSVVTVTFVGKDPQGNTVTKTSVIKVNSTPIVAKADTYTVTNGTNTTTTTGTVLDNDKLGTKTPTTTDVILTVVTTTTDVVGATKTPTLNNNGTVTVPSGTKSGTYQIVYSICERLNPNNCATATATVKVGSTPIIAKTDTYTITNGTSTTTTTGTVLDNDKLGTKTPTTTDVILRVVTTTTDVVGATKTPTLNNDGTITVPSGTKSGTYEIVYSICERLNPNNCATATATVKVGSTPIVAKADTYTVTNGTNTTTTTGTVLNNDKLGTKTPTTTDVILTVVTTTTDVVGATKTPILNNDGTVTVPSGTKSGTYEMVYSICERLNPNNCATATATVKVGSTPIVAKPDTYTVTNGTSTTTTTGTVLDNDKLGTKTPTTTDVILTVVTTTTDVVGATKTPSIDLTNGKVTVPSGTKSGTYEIVYSICERLNPDNCATATATVKVGSTPIIAKADTYTITNGISTTTTTGTVLDNDKLGTKTPTTTDVILTVVTTTTDVVGATKTPTLNNNGTITVPSGTKSGTYEIVYSICERLNPNNCATTTATVKVFVPTVATPTTIEAVNDGVTTITSSAGGTTPSVLTNDKLNGVPNPSISSVTLTWNTATPTGFTLNPNGTISVAPNTPAGTHTISYTICAVASPTVCSTASIVVTVSGTTTSTTPVLPIAVDDRSTTAINTPVVVNVLGNDTPNGATTPNVVTNPANGTVVVNLDGSIEYRPNTNFEGTDTFVYEICNTDGCASATVTIDVVNKLVPYNGISVDGDGKNDYFHIGGIERYPNNVVRIYNRWGVKVFETEGYDNVTRVFRGISNGRVTVEQAEKLPQGTYYYVIEYYDSNNNKESLVGWLYLKK
ncbi:gliding motility-associated C-terminal domain-containing protein [Capnocytophaga sputigena]|uniref:T9SS type B sorting domain-containing protein n=1 Tax=Capnocytophaga sputigena TaxID=1019 RepID=UPI0028EBA295|nr:gliding motility-associated C-terminal domain-containing protein [Capnocytophaga sputigena]